MFFVIFLGLFFFYYLFLNTKSVLIFLVLISVWLVASSTEFNTKILDEKVVNSSGGKMEIVNVEVKEKVVMCNHTCTLMDIKGSSYFVSFLDCIGFCEKGSEGRLMLEDFGFIYCLENWLFFKEYNSFRDYFVTGVKVAFLCLLGAFCFVGAFISFRGSYCFVKSKLQI